MENYFHGSMDNSTPDSFLVLPLNSCYFVRYFPAQSGRIISIFILIIALLFNLPQFFELKTVVLNSVNDTTNIIASMQVPNSMMFCKFLK